MTTFLSRSLFVLLAASLFTACSRQENVDEMTGAEMSTAATPKSSLPDLGTAPAWNLAQLDGTVLKSAELAGKVVVLDFWATWCPPCREEIPGYIAMQEELREAGVVIVGVSLDRGGPNVVQNFVTKMGINYPIVMGDQGTTEQFGGIEAIPTTFLIDREGRVRHRKVGAMSREDYEPLVRSLL